MINKFGWQGRFKIEIKNKDTKEVTEDIVNNRITNVALNAIINILDNIDPNLDIKYIAIGSSSAALNDADTKLGSEFFRAQIDSSNNTDTGEFTTTASILDTEAVGQWEEMGIFCGDSATSTADTGIMLSRILYSRDKTNLEEINITRIDKVVRS